MNASRPDARAPCIIGVGQVVARGDDPAETEPLELWAAACSKAAADTGAPPGRVLRALDSVQVVHCDSWSYDDPAGRLAAVLGAGPRHRGTSGPGGTGPQRLLHGLAGAVLRGELDLGVVASGEALHTRRQLGGEPPQWRYPHPAPKPVNPDDFFHPAELAHGFLPVMRSFALRDVARRARLGVAPDVYEREPAPVYAEMSRRAAANPAAWRPEAHSAEEILAVTARNRMPVYPYRKRMIAAPDVNLAAAVIVASAERADELGVPADRRVHVRGWAAAEDHPFVAENEDFSRSPALAAAAAEAMAGAGLDHDDLAHVDLYSCFPAALRVGADSFGFSFDDRRGLTVTGGMPFAGAPGSGAVTHAVATMTDVLRDDPTAVGVVTGVTGQLTGHSVGLYGPPGRVAPPDSDALQQRLASRRRIAIVDRPVGPAEVRGYTIGYDRDGSPLYTLAVCDLPDGRRAYAGTEETSVAAHFAATEAVGTPVEIVRRGDGWNELRPR